MKDKIKDNGLYLVAKKFNKEGSFVYCVNEQTNEIVEIFSFINSRFENVETDKNIEVSIIRGIESYKEYYPLTFINNSKEFIQKVLQGL